MNLKQLLKDHLIQTEIDNINPAYLTFNSKDVIENTLFVCKGQAFKKEYLEMAIELGASAYVSEIDYHVNIPLILVDDVRVVMPILANAFYQQPYESFNLVGITGTKGKSTTAYFYKKIVETNQKTCGILSSIDTFDGIINKESRLTTPEALDLFKHFDNARQSQLDHFVMEVSSQGLKYNRVDEVIFDYGVFLNISPDHISSIEHPNFEDYFESKLRLFSQSKVAVISLDTDRVDEVLNAAQSSTKILTFSTNNPEADYYAGEITKKNQSITFKVNGTLIELGITGLFNVDNALAAIAVAHDSGIEYPVIAEALKEIRVPGRMEYFETIDQKVKVIVDYAHNTLSFEKLFQSSINEYPDHKLAIIFGCPGGKSINRRKDLGVVANQYANQVVLTTEDPGYEDPQKISEEVLTYIPDVESVIILDRKEALRFVMDNALDKTVILFTGKGDETRQKVENQYVETQSDISITKELIEEYNKSH